jgi:hypothetical protein
MTKTGRQGNTSEGPLTQSAGQVKEWSLSVTGGSGSSKKGMPATNVGGGGGGGGYGGDTWT